MLAVPRDTMRLFPSTPLIGCVRNTKLSITLTSSLANDPSRLQTTFTRRTSGECLGIFKVHNISCVYNKYSVCHYIRIVTTFVSLFFLSLLISEEKSHPKSSQGVLKNSFLQTYNVPYICEINVKILVILEISRVEYFMIISEPESTSRPPAGCLRTVQVFTIITQHGMISMTCHAVFI